ncbi:MAG: cysteine desulfurase [Myxococcales bacterium]|nr:cysteine desulfurase [Myxococcales bacterium]
MDRVIYLDHNATTPLDPRVAERVAQVMGDPLLQGNPSSIHAWGQRARAVIERARRTVAGALGAEPLEVTFTASGTEAANLALFGAVRALRERGAPAGILTSPLEHPAVLGPVRALAAEGAPLRLVEVDGRGRISPEAVAAALSRHPEVGLVSLQAANHELGNAYPLAAIVAAARVLRPEILFHCDAVQALGKIPVDLRTLGVDLLSVSGHKIRGPKGIGALLHRRHVALEPLLRGGHQERGRRPGTEATPLIAGFARAVELAVSELDARQGPVRALAAGLRARLGDHARAWGLRLYGDPEASVGNTIALGVDGCEGQLLLINLDLEGIMVSTGSACSSGTLEPSPVLLALGCTPEEGRSVLRISLGVGNSEADLDALVAALPRAIARVRGEAEGLSA